MAKHKKTSRQAKRSARSGNDRGKLTARVLKEMGQLRGQSGAPVPIEFARKMRERQQTLLEQSQVIAQKLHPAIAVWTRLCTELMEMGQAVASLQCMRFSQREAHDAHDYYMPGGPPMSPVLDSLYVGWWLLDWARTASEDTLAQIVIGVLDKHGLHPGMADAMRMLARSHLQVCEVVQRDGGQVRLRDVALGTEVDAVCEPHMRGEPGALWLARVLPPWPVDTTLPWSVFATPYLMVGHGALQAWQAYFGRVLPSPCTAEQRLTAYRQHMKAAGTRRWLDFVTNAYTGTDDGVVKLTGIPDLARSQPHHPEVEEHPEHFEPAYGGRRLTAAHEEIRKRLEMAPEHHATAQAAQDAVMHACELIGAGDPFDHPAPIAEPLERLQRAYCLFGRPPGFGESLLDYTCRDEPPQGDGLDAEREALRNGYFGFFQIQGVRIGEGFEVRDLFSGRRYFVEAPATDEKVKVGDGIVGRAIQGRQGTLRFERGIVPIIGAAVPFLLSNVKALLTGLCRDEKPSRAQRERWLVPALLAILYQAETTAHKRAPSR